MLVMEEAQLLDLHFSFYFYQVLQALWNYIFSEMMSGEMDEQEALAPVLIGSMWFSSRGTRRGKCGGAGTR